MSKPAAGNYVIYNRVLSPTGDKLAITFNGQNANATVQPLSYNASQKVRLTLRTTERR
jgi:CCL2 lectin-like